MPSKSPSSRSHRFNIHCSKDELDKLSLAANQANLSLSRYLIESGLSFSVNSLSPYLREHIEQIKFESALLQHHLDLLLNKKSYIEQLASLGELDNLISFLSFSAKSLHDIFLADFNQNKTNQFNSNQKEINHNYYSNCPNCSNCHQLNNNSLNNEQLNHQQLNQLSDNQLSDNQLNATSSINHPLNNNQLNSYQPNTDLSINHPLNNQQLINCPLNNQQLHNNQLHNNLLNDDLLNNNQIVASNSSCDSLSNNILSSNISDISHNGNSDHSDNHNSANDNLFNLFIASGISDNKANKPTISFFCNSNIALVALNNSFSTYSPISSNSYYFYLDENIPISFVFLSSSYPVFINHCPTAQSSEASLNESSIIDSPIIDGSVFDSSVFETPIIEASVIKTSVIKTSVVDVIENLPNSTFTDSSIIDSINENLISEFSFSKNSISQNLISQNSSATTLALSPISDIAAPTNNYAPSADKEVKELNQLNILSSSSCQNIQDINIAQNIYFVSEVNLDPNLDLHADVNEANLDSACNLDANSALGIENHLGFDIENPPDPDLAPSQFHIIDDGSIDPNLIVSIPSHLLYPQDHSYSYDDYDPIDDLENFQTLENFNHINTFSPFDQLDNTVEVLESDHINLPLHSHNHHSEVLKPHDINQVLENNPTNSNSNFSDLFSSHSDNNSSSPRHSHIADLDNSDSNNRDFP